jgi:hypothetical protein
MIRHPVIERARRRVLACFRGQWPSLNLEEA